MSDKGIYRAYIIGGDDRISDVPSTFACNDDAEAIAWAKQLVDGHDIELWNGERLVIRLGAHDHGPNRPGSS